MDRIGIDMGREREIGIDRNLYALHYQLDPLKKTLCCYQFSRSAVINSLAPLARR